MKMLNRMTVAVSQVFDGVEWCPIFSNLVLSDWESGRELFGQTVSAARIQRLGCSDAEGWRRNAADSSNDGAYSNALLD